MNPTLARFVRKPLWLIVVAGSAVFAAIPAFAQLAAPAPAPAPAVAPVPPPAPAPAEGEAIVLEEYVTTGTRLTGAGVEGSLSVSVYKLDDLATGGYSNFGEMLRRKMPQFGGGIGTINEGFTLVGGTGQATISLRNLPLSNTLFLIDGRRTNADINLIPGIAIDRIEILNDGASAVYGSDAVAGVVNVILKRDYEGAELRTRYANTTDTDVGEFKVGILAGGKMGKTSLTLAVEHTTRNALMHRDRAVSTPAVGPGAVSGTSNPGLFTPVATSLNRVAGNATIAGDPGHIPGVTNVNVLMALRWFVDTPGAAITTPAGLGQPGFNPAVFLPVPLAMPIPARIAARNAEEIRLNALMVPGSNVRYGPNKVLLPGINPGWPFGYFLAGFRPQEATTLSLTTDTVISKDLTFFLDVLLSRNESVLDIGPIPIFASVALRPLTATNFWVQQVFPGNANVFGYADRPVGLGLRQVFNRFEDISITTGFKGKLDKWDWQVDFKRAEWKLSQLLNRLILADNYRAALAGTTAATAWNPFTFTPFTFLDTVNPFPGNQALLARFGTSAGLTNRESDDTVEAVISGELMDIRNGPIAVALGLYYNRFQQDDQPDRNLVNRTIFYPFPIDPPFVASRETKAIYAEFNVPVLKNLSVSAAGRIEDFSDVGRTDVKPRVSFRWEPIAHELTVRGSWAQGFVAPSVSTLFAPPFEGFTNVFNPLTGVRNHAESGTFFISNPKLQPAESDSYLVGAVYSPRNIDGLTVGINYYRIEETNVPFTSSQYVVNQWFDAGPTNPANPWGPTALPSPANPSGARVFLSPDGIIREIRNVGPINTGERMTHGIDLFANYFFTNALGDWAWEASFTEVWAFRMESFPGAGTINYLGFYWPTGAALGNYGFPVWKGSSSITWKKDRYSGSIGYNYVDGYFEKNVIENPLDDKPIRSYATFDVRLGYNIPWFDIQANVGVNNVFDEQPPFVVSSFEGQYDRAITDLRGRIVWVELSKKW